MIILDNPDKDLAITHHDVSDEEMIRILAEKVQAYLDTNINLLMSYLYRLDVKESKIKEALENGGDQSGDLILAKLIWERQKKRLETKKRYHSETLIDEEWAW